MEKLNNDITTVEDLIMRRRDYLEFLNNNFELLDERNINFCEMCWLGDKKIKYD